jgi:SAM-dependent methyltransferase
LITCTTTSNDTITIRTNSSPEGLPFKAHLFEYHPELFQYPLIRPCNPDDVLDTLTEEKYAIDKFLPYWAEQWPSSEVLLSYLNGCKIENECNILELGCGLGIISTFLASRGHTVVATDISYDALIFAKLNFEKYNGKTLPCCVDWRALPFRGSFDLIVASDILLLHVACPWRQSDHHRSLPHILE